MTKKILWFDTETTGLDPTRHSIIEIAGIVDIDGQIKEGFCFHCKPHPEFAIDDEALKIHGYSREAMGKFSEMDTIYKKLLMTFGGHIDKFDKNDKFIVAGQNIKFDIDMLSHFFMRMEDPYLGSWINFMSRIELYDITNALRSLGFINPESCSLGDICKYFEIDIEAHSAQSDIYATREAYYHIVNNLKWSGK